MLGGFGGSEIIIIGLLFLIIFGPSKLPQMARDIGKFVGNARRSIDEFKDELSAEAALDEEKPEKPARNRPSKGQRPSVNGSSAKSSVSSGSSEDEAGESSRREDGLSDL